MAQFFQSYWLSIAAIAVGVVGWIWILATRRPAEAISPEFALAMDRLQLWADTHGMNTNVRELSRCYVFAGRYLYADMVHNTRMMWDGVSWHVAERIKF